MTTTNRPVLGVLLAVAAATAVTSCGRMEGRTEWEDRIHGQPPPTNRPSATENVFPTPKPPFSEGVFPCSRCHEGGAPVADARPAFPHERHVDRKIECAVCHMADDEEADPAIPRRAVCDDCHDDPEKFSDRERAYFAAVTKADGAIEFAARRKTRDVDPRHRRHVDAGIQCTACHGPVADTPFAKPRPVTLMDRCVTCHEEKGKPVRCETCHSQTTRPAHENVVLRHAQDQRECLDCHDADDRDRLRLANGTKISFEESSRLCGQCHGTQLRDWKIGLHGKRTGEWNGART
jgi:hypothetical protein